MRRTARWVGPWLVALPLVLLGVWHAVVSPWAPLQRLEWLLADWQATRSMTPGTSAHPDIVIVDIDDRSLRELGRWPWPRERLAHLADELFERQQIAALGFDLVFAEPDDGHFADLALLARQAPALAEQLPAWRDTLDQDRRLAQALASRPIVLGWYLSADRGGTRAGPLPAPFATVPGAAATPSLPHWNGWAASLPRLGEAAPRAGYFNAWADADGVVRSVAGLARVDERLFAPLAFSLWRAAVGDPPATVQWHRVPGGLAAGALRVGEGPEARLLHLDGRGAFRVPFKGSAGPVGGRFRYVSAADLIAGRLPVGQLAGKLVLVGSSAPGLADLRPTPVHPAMPGVEVHAHLLAGLLDGDLPYRPGWAPAYEAGLVLATVAAATVLARALPAPLAMVAMSGLLLGLVALTRWAELQQQWMLPVAAAALLGSAQFMLAMLGNQLREWRRRRSVVALFSSYLPPERVRQLVRQDDARLLDAENRELSIMFCDLQGFTALAERLPPQALREVLNRFFTDATAVIQAHGGTLDKFIGDAVMAFWGAPMAQPDHAAQAVRAAMALADALAPLNQHLAERQLPPVRFGVGLSSGLVCVGDLGSTLRRSYTAVGDAVNLAARIEALTRDTGVPLLVAQATQSLAEPALPDLVWLEVDEFRVRGRARPVTLFTPIAPSAALRPASTDLLHTWHLALNAERQHHGELAQAHLARLHELMTQHPDATPPFLSQLAARLAQKVCAVPGTTA